MKKITFIILFFLVSIIAWCNCDTLFYLHRLNLPDTEETLKMEYLDSLLRAKKGGIDSLLVRKIEIAYNLGRFDIAARTYENLYSNFPENERTLSESLKLQLCYIHGLHYTKRFQECISQCREILHKKKPDSLRYYDTLVDLMLSGFNKHTNWVRVQDYILRNEALLKEAETKGWPQTTINNINMVFTRCALEKRCTIRILKKHYPMPTMLCL